MADGANMHISGDDELARDLDALARSLIDQKLLNKVGLAANRKIKKRTREGVDYLGRPFKSYSERYAELKRRAGVDPSIVNLYEGVHKVKDSELVERNSYSSSIDSLGYEVSGDFETITILFTSPRAARIMRYQNIEGAGKSKVIRENFALSDQDEQDIAELIGEELDGRLQALNLA